MEAAARHVNATARTPVIFRGAMPAGAEVLYQTSNQSRFALTYFEDDRTAPVPPAPR